MGITPADLKAWQHWDEVYRYLKTQIRNAKLVYRVAAFNPFHSTTFIVFGQ